MKHVARLVIAGGYFACVFLNGCPAPEPVIRTAVWVPPVDASAPVDPAVASTPCGRACARLRAEPCPEGYPSPGGIACEHVCIALAGALDVACVADAGPGGLAACGVRCRP